jgi:hypothetical protein
LEGAWRDKGGFRYFEGAEHGLHAAMVAPPELPFVGEPGPEKVNIEWVEDRGWAQGVNREAAQAVSVWVEEGGEPTVEASRKAWEAARDRLCRFWAREVDEGEAEVRKKILSEWEKGCAALPRRVWGTREARTALRAWEKREEERRSGEEEKAVPEGGPQDPPPTPPPQAVPPEGGPSPPRRVARKGQGHEPRPGMVARKGSPAEVPSPPQKE